MVVRIGMLVELCLHHRGNHWLICRDPVFCEMYTSDQKGMGKELESLTHFQGENELPQYFSIGLVCSRGKWKHRCRESSLRRNKVLNINSPSEVSKMMKCQRGSTEVARNPLLKLLHVWKNFLVWGMMHSHCSQMLI